MTPDPSEVRVEAAPSSPAAARTPTLSVIIVRFVGGDAVAQVLSALERQRGEPVEVLVAHRGGDGPNEGEQARWPWVRWVDGGVEASPARLRAAAVQASTGALVACTEDHCVPAAEWCAQIVASHANRSAVIGGAIDKAEPARELAWAAYLLDYGRYMPPLAAGPAAYASDCNVSYRRADLDRVRATWAQEFHETEVHGALASLGVPTVLDPAIVVRQDRAVQLAPWLAERREHGYVFAATRAKGASLAGRLRLVATALLLPPVIVWRIRGGLRARAASRRVPRAAWRPLVLAAIAWSRGELEGYLGVSR